MKYNICFTLGDPSGDGHANTSEYHIVATHSVEEITNAYKKTTELLGFDFVKEVGSLLLDVTGLTMQRMNFLKCSSI